MSEKLKQLKSLDHQAPRGDGPASAAASPISKKSFGNTTASGAKDNVKDIVFWGNGDTFKLISKASSKAEGWMKSTKALEIKNLGCLVQVTTQQGDNPAEALEFVAGAAILEKLDSDGVVIGRELIKGREIK